MEKEMLQRCKVEEVENAAGCAENFEFLPCQKKFKLKPEEEISLDSIFSALLAPLESANKLNEQCKFQVPAKDLLNEKQAVIFTERLYISRLLTHNGCQLHEKRIFLESELQEIGSFKLSVEESYDGYVVFGKSQLLKEKTHVKSGHWFKGKYDDKLNLIGEKRSEYDFVDKARIEKNLDARLNGEKIILKRETKINNEAQRFRAVINVKDRSETFMLEGGVLLLARYLIVNNIFGDFNYFSMGVQGKVLRCQLTIYQQRTQIQMFQRTFKNAIHVRNTHYFNDYPQEVSDTYYTAAGKLILHYWHNFNYIVHETKGFVAKQELIVPKLELMWRSHNQLLNQYRLKEKLNHENALAYFQQHPELSDFLHDFILNVIKYKPNNLLEFTVKYFHKFKKPSNLF